MDEEKFVLICKALGDSNRVQIMRKLAEGEKCGCKLLEDFQITQPTLSHHMKVLCDSGLVVSRKEGKWSHYKVNNDTLIEFREYLDSLRER